MNEQRLHTEMKVVGPVFTHDCESCRFLGHYDGNDLYYCHPKTQLLPTVVARFGDDGPEYTSAVPVLQLHPSLAEAARLARSQGLLTDEQPGAKP